MKRNYIGRKPANPFVEMILVCLVAAVLSALLFFIWTVGTGDFASIISQS